METNRNLKELLILLRDYIINQDDDDFYGMCNAIYEMWEEFILNSIERRLLRDLLEDNIPKGLTKQEYWFTRGEKPPRIEWLNEQINEL